MKKILSGGCLLALAVFIAAEAQTPVPNPVLNFPAGRDVVKVPIEIFEGVPYVPVRIPSFGRDLAFILDTGAGGIVAVDEDVAREAGLALTGEFPLGGAGEKTNVGHFIEKGRYSSGGLSYEGGPQITIPLHGMDPFWGKRKDGLIGGVWIAQAIAVLDYENAELAFHRRETFSWPAGGHTIPVTVEGQFLFAPVKVHLRGQEAPIETIMMLDTGLRGMTFCSPFSKDHDLAGRSPKTLDTVLGYGIGGVSRGIVGRVQALEIGDVLIKEPAAGFSTDKNGALADPGYAGIIGAEILRRFRITFDYAGNRINLRENKSFSDPSEFDMSGLWFRCEGSDFRTFIIQTIAAGTPAQKSGLAAEDRLVEVDGKPAGTFNLESLRRYFKQSGKTVALTVRRGEKNITVSLRLERLV